MRPFAIVVVFESNGLSVARSFLFYVCTTSVRQTSSFKKIQCKDLCVKQHIVTTMIKLSSLILSREREREERERQPEQDVAYRSVLVVSGVVGLWNHAVARPCSSYRWRQQQQQQQQQQQPDSTASNTRSSQEIRITHVLEGMSLYQ